MASFGIQPFNYETVGELLPFVDDKGNATDFLCPNKSRNFDSQSATQKEGFKSKKKWWGNFGFGSHRFMKESKQSRNKNEIFLCLRGNCLFEEKASTAQELGAKALIIANNEVNLHCLFIQRLTTLSTGWFIRYGW